MGLQHRLPTIVTLRLYSCADHQPKECISLTSGYIQFVVSVVTRYILVRAFNATWPVGLLDSQFVVWFVILVSASQITRLYSRFHSLDKNDTGFLTLVYFSLCFRDKFSNLKSHQAFWGLLGWLVSSCIATVLVFLGLNLLCTQTFSTSVRLASINTYLSKFSCLFLNRVIVYPLRSTGIAP